MRQIFVLSLIVFTNISFASVPNRVTVVTDTVEFVMGTGFTAEEAYNRVLARAKRLAVDKAAATYVQSYSRVEDYVLTQDIIDAVQAGTVIDYDILWKNDDAEETGVQRIVMKAVVECPSIDELRRAVGEKSPYEVGVKRGELYVNSYPPGATIYIDGDKQAARTPHTFRELEEGRHDITLRKENYRPDTKTVYISQTDPQMVDLILKRPRGRLKITSNVRGARVDLDNKYIGTAPVTTEELLTGIHDLTVTGPEDYEPYTAEVEVRVDEINEVDVRLRKRPGNILVFTNPPGARVSLEGTGLSGIADDSYAFKNVEPKSYLLACIKKGFTFENKLVNLPPGNTIIVEFFGKEGLSMIEIERRIRLVNEQIENEVLFRVLGYTAGITLLAISAVGASKGSEGGYPDEAKNRDQLLAVIGCVDLVTVPIIGAIWRKNLKNKKEVLENMLEVQWEN